MNITGVSMTDNLATMATNLQSNNMSLQFGTAVMKNILDSQKQQGEALVRMINQTPSLNGTGTRIDISV
jgi:hypothetical protein